MGFKVHEDALRIPSSKRVRLSNGSHNHTTRCKENGVTWCNVSYVWVLPMAYSVTWCNHIDLLCMGPNGV